MIIKTNTRPDAGLSKIDNAAVLGLGGTADSLAYKVHEIEKHFHNVGKCFGNSSGNMVENALTAFQASAGNGAWATETQIYDGTTIESGSTTKKFDLNRVKIIAVGNVNRLTILNFQTFTKSTAKAATEQNAGDTVTPTSAADVPADGSRVMIAATGIPGGASAFTVYYTVNATATTFQLSLTSGGAPILLSGDGTASFYVCTAFTDVTSTYVSRTATSTDSYPSMLVSPRLACNAPLLMRAQATGGTNTVDFVIELHTYAA